MSAATAGPQVRRAAERALALDPTLADAHGQMAVWSLTYGYDPAAAVKEMEQALKLDSANVAAGAWYPFLVTNYAHLPDSARDVTTRAQRLNSLSLRFGTRSSFRLILRSCRRTVRARSARGRADSGADGGGVRGVAALDSSRAERARSGLPRGETD